jgi:hypothetical protein
MEETGFYRFEIFKEFYKQEARRLSVMDVKSTFVYLSTEKIQDIIAQEGIGYTKRMSKELRSILRSTLRNTIYLPCSVRAMSLLSSLIPISRGAETAIIRLRDRIASFLKRIWILNMTYKDI